MSVAGWYTEYKGKSLTWRYDALFASPELVCPQCARRVMLTTGGKWQRHHLTVDRDGAVTLDRPVLCRCGWAVVIRHGQATDIQGSHDDID